MNNDFWNTTWYMGPSVAGNVDSALGTITVSGSAVKSQTRNGFNSVLNSWHSSNTMDSAGNYDIFQTNPSPVIRLGKHDLTEELLDKMVLLLEAIEALGNECDIKTMMDTIAMMKKIKSEDAD